QASQPSRGRTANGEAEPASQPSRGRTANANANANGEAEPASQPSRGQTANANAAVAHPTSGVREIALWLADPPGARPLFGVLTGPAGGGDPTRPLILFLNAGAVHRVGPNRMYVTLARAFAERGLTSARIDLGGLGDSAPAAGAPENKIYSTDVVGDVRA